MKTPRTPVIQRVEKTMPFTEPFVCFEDAEVILTTELQWVEPTTGVDRIDFLLENKVSSPRYKIHSLTQCEDEEEGVFYRMTLVEEEEAPTYATLSAPENILGNLDLAESEQVFIKFNCIRPDQIEYYDENSCAINTEKPRSKDGTIIISV